MKSSKSVIFGLAMLLGVAGAFSSKASKPSLKATAVWWSFGGTQAQINDPAMYTLSSSEPGCSAGSNRCAVEANRSSTNPNQPNLATIVKEDLKP